MEIRLTEHLAKFVNNKVEEGGYEDASEVVREALRNFEAGGRPVKGAMDGDIGALAKIKGDLDSLSEMGEMESLRLQMAMDRLSKMMSTLSNLLKKMSDTASSITQNIK
ncbi:MAG: type II toxin-antitoxin system ParD family antitoxin [Pseudolabrys sp.]